MRDSVETHMVFRRKEHMGKEFVGPAQAFPQAFNDRYGGMFMPMVGGVTTFVGESDWFTKVMAKER